MGRGHRVGGRVLSVTSLLHFIAFGRAENPACEGAFSVQRLSTKTVPRIVTTTCPYDALLCEASCTKFVAKFSFLHPREALLSFCITSAQIVDSSCEQSSGPGGRWFKSTRPDHFLEVRPGHMGYRTYLRHG